MKIITQISRVLVGVLFIISGFIKANDTLGFSYKLLEYFEIFKMPFFDPYAVPFSMFICIFEIVSGIALLLGIYNRLNAWLLLLMIVFFTILTGYSAITHKVTDCGCFGDAIKFTPMQSFMKDIVLMILIIIIFLNTKLITPLFNIVISNIVLSVAFLVSTAFTIYTYMFLPVIDFLPYKIGNDIKALSMIPEGESKGEYEFVFIYEKEGKKYEFNANNLPADLDSYKFIDRTQKTIKEPFKPLIHDFKVADEYGVDFTDSLFSSNQYKLILVQTKINETRTGTEAQIENLSKECLENHLEFWALTASNLTEANAYKKTYNLNFTYYNMDGTPLKSMARSNPALILLKKSTVVKKWSAYNLPSYKTILKYMK